MLNSECKTKSITYSNKYLKCKKIVTGCINGMGASLLWIGQGKYVSQWCTEENKGFYFSIVWLLFSLSSLLGSLFGKNSK